MDEEDQKPPTPAEAVELLRSMEETNKAVAQLLSDFLEKPIAGNPSAIRDFHNHQNKIVLHLILNQQKQIKGLQTVLTTFAAQTIQNSRALGGVAQLLNANGLMPPIPEPSKDADDDNLEASSNDDL